MQKATPSPQRKNEKDFEFPITVVSLCFGKIGKEKQGEKNDVLFYFCRYGGATIPFLK